MRESLRSRGGRRLARWSRAAGVVLLLIAFFAPIPGGAVLAVLVPGLILFVAGAAGWVLREEGPWFR